MTLDADLDFATEPCVPLPLGECEKLNEAKMFVP